MRSTVPEMEGPPLGVRVLRSYRPGGALDGLSLVECSHDGPVHLLPHSTALCPTCRFTWVYGRGLVPTPVRMIVRLRTVEPTQAALF